MYRIYADDELVYSPDIPDSKYRLESAVLTTELNRAGSLELVIPPTHILYDKLQLLKTNVSVKHTKDGNIEKSRFFGRVLNSERDLDYSRKVVCEGDLAFLNDSIQRPYSFIRTLKWAFSQFTARHNSEVASSDRRFIVGICDMSTDDIAYDATSYGAHIITNGTVINHTISTGTTVDNSDVSYATAGTLYLNRLTYRLYKCIVGGDASTALWGYIGNIKDVVGDVAEYSLFHYGSELYGTSTQPTEMHDNAIDNLEIGDIYINNTTYYIYKCVQRELTAEERQDYGISYDESPVELWVYLGSIAQMVAAADKRFATGALYFSSEEYSSSMDLFSDVLLTSYGGYIYTSEASSASNARLLNWTKKSGVVSNQVIQFGNNITDFSEHVSAESVVTRIIPIGAEVYDDEGNDLGYKVTIASANKGIDYIENKVAVNTFGAITRAVEFEDGTTPEILLDLAEKYLQEAIKMAISLELTAIDLSVVNVDIDDILVGNSYRVICEPFGIDEYFICSKAEVDILHPEDSRFTFGVDRSSFTSLVTKSNYVTSAEPLTSKRDPYVPKESLTLVTERSIAPNEELVDADEPQLVGANANSSAVIYEDRINVESSGITITTLKNDEPYKSTLITSSNFKVMDDDNPQLQSGIVYWSVLSARRCVIGNLYVTIYHCGNLFWAHFDGQISAGWSGIIDAYLPIVADDDSLEQSILCAPPQPIVTHAVPYIPTNPRLSIAVLSDGRLGLKRIVYPLQGDSIVTVEDYIQTVDIFWAKIEQGESYG